MTVKELKELLNQCPPNAVIHIWQGGLWSSLEDVSLTTILLQEQIIVNLLTTSWDNYEYPKGDSHILLPKEPKK